MAIEINLFQAKSLVTVFGNDTEGTVEVSRENIGHSGPGLYVHYPDYPEEGSLFLYETEEDEGAAEDDKEQE